MEMGLLLFLTSLILELVGAVLVFSVFDSPCIMGEEVSLFVNIYMPLILPVLVTDLVKGAFRIITDIHKDPLGTYFNMVNGVLCVVSGISLMLVLIKFCGNPALVVLCVAGAFTVIAGVAHLMTVRSRIVDKNVIAQLGFRRSSGMFHI